MEASVSCRVPDMPASDEREACPLTAAPLLLLSQSDRLGDQVRRDRIGHDPDALPWRGAIDLTKRALGVVVVGRAGASQAGWKSWREAISAMRAGVRPPLFAAAASSRR